MSLSGPEEFGRKEILPRLIMLKQKLSSHKYKFNYLYFFSSTKVGGSRKSQIERSTNTLTTIQINRKHRYKSVN